MITVYEGFVPHPKFLGNSKMSICLIVPTSKKKFAFLYVFYNIKYFAHLLISKSKL